MISLCRRSVQRVSSSWASTKSSPSFLVLLLLACALPLVTCLIDSWSFPWYGNPDQDLVFLRDGVRLWNFRPPLYGDHPGLLQMLVVWMALLFLKLLAAAGFVQRFDPAYLDDSGWQQLFVAAKTVNVVNMVALLFVCSVMLLPWLARGRVLLWAIGCGASMALVSEVYQLRNEFYSMYFILIAVLVSINWFALGRKWLARDEAIKRSSFLFATLAALVCIACSFLGLMAKVQALPVLLSLPIVVIFATFVLSERHLFLSYLACLLWISGCILVGALFFVGSKNISLFQSLIVFVAIAGPPSLLISSAISGTPKGLLGLDRVWLAAGSLSFCGVSAVFMFVADRFQWLELILNPFAARVHAVAYGSCPQGAVLCAVRQGVRGFSYLFERSIDSYLLASSFGFFVLFTCVLSLYRAPRVVRGSGGLGMNYTRFVMVVSGCACLLLAMAMAGVAGQRWAVDHYLAYQQPLLLAGLLIMSRASISFVWFWRVASLLVVLSIVLIYLRYPMSSRATYVKESIVLSPDVGRGDGALCARQHAGVEWVHSSLWGLCGGFGDD